MSDWLKELEKKIVDPTILDQDVYDAFFKEPADETPQQDALSLEDLQKQAEAYGQEMERIRKLLEQTRPQVYARIIEGVIAQHQNCCGSGCGNCE